ncbi:DciA family protein [Auritidibacter ignavus]|uniref:DciA family protein n=1 Tax=Auritidibacter ignavus TaxID=678932 RepID=A0AAJ6DBL9_9MICC|nr:DciA family protein [Auritidibacter ignavus]WGH92549.1 DciA family protein [Auritidibacter ignavus]WHS29071.1 DciA family protein [Auritidibacter ignavus]
MMMTADELDAVSGVDHDSIDAAFAALQRVRRTVSQAGYTPGDPDPNVHRSRRGSSRRGTRRAPSVRRRAAADVDNQFTSPLPKVKSLDELFGGLVADRGWKEPVAVGSVLGRWEDLVGPQVAEHCQIESFEHAVLVVRCSTTSWATQLRLMSAQILQRINTALGREVVREITINGPAAPSWRKGPRVVRGRGPRDTYG